MSTATERIAKTMAPTGKGHRLDLSLYFYPPSPVIRTVSAGS
jgi:hypothetical protein